MAIANRYEAEAVTGEQAYSLWHSRITSTLAWRKDNYDREWQRAYDLYKGNHWRDQDITDDPRADDPREKITINKTASMINNLVPFLLNSEAVFHAKPKKPTSVVTSNLQEAIVNYEYKHQDMQSQIEKCVYDAVIIGHGICKTGFTLELDEGASKAEGDIVYEDYVKAETPWIKRIDPFLFLFDPSASEYNLETARWCAEIYFKSIPDIIGNESYSESARNKIKQFGMTTKTTLFGAQADGAYAKELSEVNNPQAELGVLYEVWDKKHNKMYVFADGIDEPLIEQDNPYPYLNGEFPYAKVGYMYVPNDQYEMGLCVLVEDIQLENDRRRTYALNHCRRFNRKYEILNTLDESAKQMLADVGDGALIEVTAIGSVKPIEDAPISQDYQLAEALLTQDFQEISGLDALLRGGQLPSRTTAGEVNARTNLFMLKLDGRIKSVNRFILKIINQVAGHISANYVTDKVVKIVGKEGEYWTRYSVEDILDQVDWDMEAVNAPKIDPVLDRQQRLQIFQLIMNPVTLQMVQGGMFNIDLNELFKWLLESFDRKDIGRFFKTALVPNAPLVEGETPLGGAVPPQPQEQISTTPPTQPDLANQVGGPALASGLGGM